MSPENSTNPAPVNLGAHSAGSVSESAGAESSPGTRPQNTAHPAGMFLDVSAAWWAGYAQGHADRGAEDAPLIAAAARGGEWAGRAAERRAVDADYTAGDPEHREHVKAISRGVDAVAARTAAAERAAEATYQGGPVDFATGAPAPHGRGWAA